MGKKIAIEELHILAKTHDGECLSKEYINSHTKYIWKCDNTNHASFLASHNNVKTKNSWCPECKGEDMGKRNSIFFKGYKFSKERNEKLSKIAKKKGFGKWMLGRKLPESTCQKISNTNMGHATSQETILKIKSSKLKNPYTHNNEAKRKMRLSRIAYLTKIINGGGQISPNYNINACKIIDEYGKENGYNFQHAMNGGEFYIKELGYWVDGYDKDKNTVFEYDEKHHFDINGNLKPKDINRQANIINYLNCKFIRYNKITNEVKEY